MSKPADRLDEYNTRRDFSRTAEPEGKAGHARRSGLRFLVQKHEATRLHYDLRLEWDGVLLSWAVTRGPSADPGEKRLAVRTEDHPLSYGEFEGTIPEGEYGGGTVMLWDQGTWTPAGDPEAGLAEGKLKFTLNGARMRGGWTLVRMKTDDARENWLLIKERDTFATDAPDALTEENSTSVKTGRNMAEIAAGATGAKPPSRSKPRPEFRKPQLATLVDAAPEGDGWIHETKFDGYRCLVALGKGGTRLFTRSGKDWTDRFAALEGAFDPLPCDSALIDGEVMAARTGKGSAFSALQAALGEGGPLVFYAFDLLSLDGTDLTGAPQIERRERLAALFADLPQDGPLRLSAHVRGNGPEVFARACAAGGEGIVSKRADAPYRGRRTKAWRKVKCTRRQEFVIGGYAPSDKTGRPFASLLLGEFGPDGLRYRGRVGTGFSESDFEHLTGAMTPRKTSPFAEVPKAVARGAKWVRPDLVAEIDFAELTADGHIRHGSYLGLREDKEAKTVTLETPKDGAAEVAGVTITSAGREVFPKAGCTKGDVARHYDRVGARTIEIAGHRPLSLLRCPDGIAGDCFFQKHGGKGFPAALQRIEIAEKDGERAEYLYATRPEALVAAAQMGTIEFHIWGARTDRLERPDRLVFDLDPGEGTGWTDVIAAATQIRRELAELDLAATPVVTGGKGVHVCVPLRRTQGWEAVKSFAKTFAHVIAAAAPERYTATMSKSKRKGRIFIDWLRNERGATAIAPYSLRAREGAPVAVPVTWEELEGMARPAPFGIADMAARLERPCPYLEALNDLQTLGAATAERLERRIGQS